MQEAKETAKQVCQNLSEWKEYARLYGIDITPKVLIEGAIPRNSSRFINKGAEFSVEFLSLGAQHYCMGITEKWSDNNFIECAHIFPACRFPQQLETPLKQVIKDLLSHLEVTYGISHWEFIVTEDEKLALVEGHLRPAGDRITDLIQLSTGVSPYSGLFNGLLGYSLNENSFTPKQVALIRFLRPENPLYEVSEIEILEETYEDIIHLEVNKEGIISQTNWIGPTSWQNRYAKVIATGKSEDEALRNSKESAAKVILKGKTKGGTSNQTILVPIDSIG